MKSQNKQQSKLHVGRRKELVNMEAESNQYKYEHKKLLINAEVVL